MQLPATKRQIDPQAGYTLIELLVYIAIFAIVIVAVINASVMMMRTASNATANHTLEENGYAAMDGIARMIRPASVIDRTNSVFDSNNGALMLDYYDSAGMLTTKKIYVSNYYYLNWWTEPHQDVRAVQVDQNGALLAPFTGRNVEVNSLVFRRIQTAVGEAVKVELTLTARNSRVPRTEHFYDTIVLRGSY